jgi:hypothetical protein
MEVVTRAGCTPVVGAAMDCPTMTEELYPGEKRGASPMREPRVVRRRSRDVAGT